MTNPIAARIATLETAQLIEMAGALFADDRDGADAVFMGVVMELEKRMPEAEFIKLTDEIADRAAA